MTRSDLRARVHAITGRANRAGSAQDGMDAAILALIADQVQAERERWEREELQPKLWRARHTIRGRCRYCSAVIDHNCPHDMGCPLYEGPIEHRWVSTRVNGTFGGIDYDCVCGGWFRKGGLAGHGDGSDAAEPVCPQVEKTWRTPDEAYRLEAQR